LASIVVSGTASPQNRHRIISGDLPARRFVPFRPDAILMGLARGMK
jgi:hypothetical protein